MKTQTEYLICPNTYVGPEASNLVNLNGSKITGIEITSLLPGNSPSTGTRDALCSLKFFWGEAYIASPDVTAWTTSDDIFWQSSST